MAVILISGNIVTNNLKFKTAKKELQQGSENIFNIIIVSLLINFTNSIIYLFKGQLPHQEDRHGPQVRRAGLP